MNYCKKCSRILDNSDATVCPYCGEPLENDSPAREMVSELPSPANSEDMVIDEIDAEPLEDKAYAQHTEPPKESYEPVVDTVSTENAALGPEAAEAATPEADLDSKLDEINRRIADNKQAGADNIPPVASPYGSATAVPPSASYGSSPSPSPSTSYGSSPSLPPSASYGSSPSAASSASYGSSPSLPPSASYGSSPSAPPSAPYGSPSAPYGGTPTPPPSSYGGAPTPPPSAYGSAPRGTGYSAYSPPPAPNNGTYGAPLPRYAPAPPPAGDNSPTGIGYLILAIFLPIIGIIVGVVMMNDVTPKKKRDGKNVLYISLIQIGFFVLMCCCFYAFASSGSDLLYDLFY